MDFRRLLFRSGFLVLLFLCAICACSMQRLDKIDGELGLLYEP
jgi:hypothetical protein